MNESFMERLKGITPWGRWSKREPAAGVTVLERRDNFHATVLTATPGLHIHYFTTDEELDRRGWGFVHLVCHECSKARAVMYPNWDDADIPDDGYGLYALRVERERFAAEHRRHVGLYASGGGRFLCPPQYTVEDVVNLRERAAVPGTEEGEGQ